MHIYLTNFQTDKFTNPPGVSTNWRKDITAGLNCDMSKPCKKSGKYKNIIIMNKFIIVYFFHQKII